MKVEEDVPGSPSLILVILIVPTVSVGVKQHLKKDFHFVPRGKVVKVDGVMPASTRPYLSRSTTEYLYIYISI